MFLTEAANRGSISTGFNIDNSLKFEADNSEYMHYTPGSQTDYERMAFSVWLKRTELGTTQTIAEFGNGTANTTNLRIGFDTNDKLFIYGNSIIWRESNRRFRDTSAWYHFFFLFDTTTPGGLSNNRIRVWVNGEMIDHTDFGTINNPGAGSAMGFNKTNQQSIGAQREDGPKNYFCGYMAQVYGSGGTPPVVGDFGEYDDNGIWTPIDISGITPPDTHGFNLDFSNASSLGNDISSRNNDMTLVNIAAVDQATDTPTNNFCTLNPLSYNVPYTASQGNTKWSKSDTTYGMASGTQYVAAGKWYWEIKATDFGTYSSCSFGIIDAHKPTVDANERGYEDPSLSAGSKDILAMSGAPNNWFMNSNSTIANNGSTNSVDYTFYEGDILAFALDMDNGGYWMGCSRYSGVNNGSFWIAPGGTTTSGSVATTDPTNGNYALVGDGGGTNNGTPNFNGGTINGGSLLTAGFTFVTPLLGAYHSNTTVTLEVNFGGFTSYGETGGYSDANGYGNFAYSVPSGFYALCTKNLAEYG